MATQSQLNYHMQRFHQMKATIKFPNGEIVEIIRDVDSKQFGCPKCGDGFDLPKYAQRHASSKCNKKKSAKARVSKMTGGENIIRSPLLFRFGLYVNEKVGVLVCTKCQFCIAHNETKIRSHLHRTHKISTKDLPDAADLATALGSTRFLSEHEMIAFSADITLPIEPVEGLPIVYDGQMCISCKYVCHSKDAFRRHLKSHKTSETKMVALQTFFTGPRKRYFQVTVPIPSDDRNGDDVEANDSVSLELAKFSMFVNQSCVAESDERLIPQLLRKLKWHKKIEMYAQCSFSELLATCKLPHDTRHGYTFENNVRAAVSSFFKFGSMLLQTAPYLILRNIKAGSFDVKDFHQGFHGVDDESANYQRHMMRLIYMVKVSQNMKNNQAPVWNFATSSDVDTAVSNCTLHALSKSLIPTLLKLRHWFSLC